MQTFEKERMQSPNNTTRRMQQQQQQRIHRKKESPKSESNYETKKREIKLKSHWRRDQLPHKENLMAN